MQFTLPLGDETRFTWRKPGTSLGTDFASSWTLTLDLMSASHRRHGSLVLYRLCNGRDLQVDVNLLTSEFALVLANALDRVPVDQPEIANSHPEPIFAAAQVS
jgi:hypothetical protein